MVAPKRCRVAAVISVVGLVLAACAGGAPGSPSASAAPSPAGSAAGGGVEVTLQEWAVVPAVESAAAGEVAFQVTNSGPEDVHEFVIVRTDLDPASLPTADDGSVDEAGEGVEVVDEIEDIPVGESQELTVTLEAGAYVLLCNIYDETEDEAHYEMGMRTGFTVQ